jgi:hypothetical protein
LEDEALATVPDDARGAAVQARFRYARTCDDRDNEMGDHGPEWGDTGEPVEWKAAKALEAKAHAIDPNFKVW